MMSDCTTRLLAARHLRGGEKTEAFIKHLERAWIRNFRPMRILQVDEHRAWSSDAMRQWCTENGVQLQISPGQSLTRNVATRWHAEPWTSSWTATRALQARLMRWSQRWITWFPRSAENQMSVASALSNGPWDTHPTCQVCSWKNRTCTTQRRWTLPKPSWRSSGWSNRQWRPFQRPTWTAVYGGPFYGSLWASRRSWIRATYATTGEMPLQDQMQSWGGVDPPLSSCVRQVHLVPTQTSTGLDMGQSYFVRLQNMSKLHKLLSTSLRRPLTPWSLQRIPSNTSEIEVSHTMWTWARLTRDDVTKWTPMRRREKTTETWILWQCKTYHQIDGKSVTTARFGHGSTTCPGRSLCSCCRDGHPSPPLQRWANHRCEARWSQSRTSTIPRWAATTPCRSHTPLHLDGNYDLHRGCGQHVWGICPHDAFGFRSWRSWRCPWWRTTFWFRWTCWYHCCSWFGFQGNGETDFLYFDSWTSTSSTSSWRSTRSSRSWKRSTGSTGITDCSECDGAWTTGRTCCAFLDGVTSSSTTWSTTIVSSSCWRRNLCCSTKPIFHSRNPCSSRSLLAMDLREIRLRTDQRPTQRDQLERTPKKPLSLPAMWMLSQRTWCFHLAGLWKMAFYNLDKFKMNRSWKATTSPSATMELVTASSLQQRRIAPSTWSTWPSSASPSWRMARWSATSGRGAYRAPDFRATIGRAIPASRSTPLRDDKPTRTSMTRARTPRPSICSTSSSVSDQCPLRTDWPFLRLRKRNWSLSSKIMFGFSTP